MASAYSLFNAQGKAEFDRDEAIEAALKDCKNEDEQIDAVAKIRGYFQPDDEGLPNTTIRAYMSGTLEVEEAVNTLAIPIEKAYTSANNGREYWRQEKVARTQRGYHSPEKAAEMWGVEQDFEEPADPNSNNYVSTEGQLWDLWYAVVHAARKVDWKDAINQRRLLDLVKALKSRQDPPLPANITIPMRRDWIYETGTLWSDLLLSGAAFREAWNDSPGCGAGWYEIELISWRDLNSFTARMCAEKLVPWWSFCTWAMRDLIEGAEQGKGLGSHKKTKLNVAMRSHVPTAAAWIHGAGKEVYELCMGRREGWPYMDKEWLKEILEEFTVEEWERWKKCFYGMSERKRIDEDIQQIAREAAEEMERIESAVRSGEVEGIESN